jgi:uncharacterized membrane protein YiaA
VEHPQSPLPSCVGILLSRCNRLSEGYYIALLENGSVPPTRCHRKHHMKMSLFTRNHVVCGHQCQVLVIGPILIMILVPQAPVKQAFHTIFTLFFATICSILVGIAVASTVASKISFCPKQFKNLYLVIITCLIAYIK